MDQARVRGEDGEPKFKAGDVVRRTAARMRSMGIVSGPVNGIVVAYSGKWPLIRWSNMSDADEPMAQAEEGLELDKRAMAKRGHARKIRRDRPRPGVRSRASAAQRPRRRRRASA